MLENIKAKVAVNRPFICSFIFNFFELQQIVTKVPSFSLLLLLQQNKNDFVLTINLNTYNCVRSRLF